MIKNFEPNQVVYFHSPKIGSNIKPPAYAIRKGIIPKVPDDTSFKNPILVTELTPNKGGKFMLTPMQMYHTRKEAKEAAEKQYK